MERSQRSPNAFIRSWPLVAALLVGCSGNDGRYEDPAVDDDRSEAATTAEGARQAVYEERGADTDGSNADASQIDAEAVEDDHDYACSEDCSGHEAGFSWAKEKDITDASDCGGNSQSFIEGCESFVEARQEQADNAAREAADDAASDADADDESEDSQ